MMLRGNSLNVLTMFVAGSVLGLATVSAWATLETPDIPVSQKGRAFAPLSVDLKKDQALVIVNDDGDLLHHAYVESDSFSFDSGDQQPGSRTRVVFSVPGDFKVLCGIHPKMKLTVHVD